MALSKDYLFFIKSSWLAGNKREDVAAEIISFEVQTRGIVLEREVYTAISAVYDTLNLEYFSRLQSSCVEIYKGQWI